MSVDEETGNVHALVLTILKETIAELRAALRDSQDDRREAEARYAREREGMLARLLAPQAKPPQAVQISPQQHTRAADPRQQEDPQGPVSRLPRDLSGDVLDMLVRGQEWGTKPPPEA